MNDVDARSVPVIGGYQGQMRKVHRAEYEPVCVNGVPQVYRTSQEAEIAAWRALREHIRGDIVGSGEKSSAAASDAEAKFGRIFRGGGKTVTV
jgi:hypothetical protein